MCFSGILRSGVSAYGAVVLAVGELARQMNDEIGARVSARSCSSGRRRVSTREGLLHRSLL